MKRSRLKRGMNKPKESRLVKVRSQIVMELRQEPTVKVRDYARIGDKAVLENPAMALLRSEARKELQRRKTALAEWKTGRLPPEAEKKESLISKIVRGEQKALGLVGKGIHEYMKLISGETAHELQEAIETAGMKPEEKKAYLRKKKEAEEKARKEEEKEFEKWRTFKFGEI
jgi:hypothetical protein